MKVCIQTFLLFGIFACLGGCGSQATQETSVDASTYFTIQIGAETTELQLAISDPERSKGLMHRAALDEHHGMLFLFDKTDRLSFWMRNTPLKLDIGYFDETGKLLETHSLYPYDETPVKSYSQNVLIAVEMNHGWFAKNKVRPGDMINLSDLNSALQKRGKTIGDYPLLNTN